MVKFIDLSESVGNSNEFNWLHKMFNCKMDIFPRRIFAVFLLSGVLLLCICLCLLIWWFLCKIYYCQCSEMRMHFALTTYRLYYVVQHYIYSPHVSCVDSISAVLSGTAVHTHSTMLC